MLIDGPVQVRTPTGDLDVGLIGEPPVARGVSARAGGLDELHCEALDPAVDGDVIDGDAALGQQLLYVAVGQAVAQVPADGQGDHLPREAEASEHRRGARRRHRTSLLAAAIAQRNRAPRLPRTAQPWRSRSSPDTPLSVC